MSQRAALCARLAVVVEDEERFYLELRALLQRERERIVALDAAGLDEIVRRKESLAEEGRLLEESRLAIARELSLELALGDERPTLSALCARLGAEADGLRAAHARLVAIVGATRELLDANAAFAGEARAQVSATLRLLGRLLPVSGAYDAQGVPPLAPGPGRLVERSA